MSSPIGSQVVEGHAATQLESLTMTASGTVTRYAQTLLNEAQDLLNRGEHALAIVVAHTACELAVGHAISHQLEKRGVGEIAENIRGMLGSYNITNGRVHALFKSLTTIHVPDRPFWNQFVLSVGRRNGVVHRGEKPTQQEAQASLQVAGEVVNFFLPFFD